MILLSLDLIYLQTSKDRFILISYLYYALIYLSLLNDTSLTIVGVMLNMIRRMLEIEEEISSSNNMKPNPTISILLLFFQIIGSLKTKSWPIQVPRVSSNGVHLRELTVVHARNTDLPPKNKNMILLSLDLFYLQTSKDRFIDAKLPSVARGEGSFSYSILCPVYLKRRISANICFHFCK